jgi:hypothetical protein
MKSILDRTFRYTPSVQTDIRKTFARVRGELRKKADAEAKAIAEAEANTAKVHAIIDARRRAGK